MPPKGTGVRPVDRVCEWCGLVFPWKPWAGRWSSNRGRFCCVAHVGLWRKHSGPRGEQSPVWKGENASPHTKRQRAGRLIPLTGRVCAECEVAPATDRHHWDRDATNDDPTNIVLLCDPCHHRIHKQLATHCRRGHPFDAANTGWTTKGTRFCRTCMRAARARWNRRQGMRPRATEPVAFCFRDHAMEGENVYLSPSGQRQCVACRRLREQRRPPRTVR